MKWISSGNKHASAVDCKGNLYMWGSGNCGELGVGDAVKLNVPILITPREQHNYKASYCKNNMTALITSKKKSTFLGI